jgi:hypothetical protein
VQSRSGKAAEGKATLRALAQDAKSKGFELMAQKAQNGN